MGDLRRGLAVGFEGSSTVGLPKDALERILIPSGWHHKSRWCCSGKPLVSQCLLWLGPGFRIQLLRGIVFGCMTGCRNLEPHPNQVRHVRMGAGCNPCRICVSHQWDRWREPGRAACSGTAAARQRTLALRLRPVQVQVSAGERQNPCYWRVLKKAVGLDCGGADVPRTLPFRRSQP